MKLVQHIKLFFKEGNSDKVYQIDLCAIDSSNYVVNFRYGRRGSVLKEGTKTPEYTTLEKAQLIFAKLENEKKAKGYASEIETLIDLPSLVALAPDSPNGVLLQRLEDAVMGKESFKTQWKTSRVIWKAGLVQCQEAVPYIIKLVSKGDAMQSYASLWALIQLKATVAEGVFWSYALQAKQKEYLKNLAHEGLLTILKDEALESHLLVLLENLPPAVKYHIDKKEWEALVLVLKEDLEQNALTYLTHLYLLAKYMPDLHTLVLYLLEAVAFKPPYFKHIRAVYKLAVLRQDSAVIAVLAYRFEKEKPMYSRTVSLDNEDDNQYIPSINQTLNVGRELKGSNSKIAFSNFTKIYFQKHSLRFLKEFDQNTEAKSYLQFAVAILLQYTEADYTKALKAPVSTYGQYNYKEERYYYTVIDSPECANLLLLTSLLFGNDSSRILTPNLQFILNKETFWSKNYYFDPNEATKITGDSKKKTSESVGSLIAVAKKALSSFFGKKEAAKASEPIVVKPTETPALPKHRLALFIEKWDAHPEAYIQLLMQGQMNIIHDFAFSNLKTRADYKTLLARFEAFSILELLNSAFEKPNALGVDVVEVQKESLSKDYDFVADVLNSKTAAARNWSKNQILYHKMDFLSKVDPVVKLLFNQVPDLNSWIKELLESYTFSDDKAKIITGKLLVALLVLEESEANNKLANTAIERLQIVASRQLQELSWDMVAKLIASDLKANNLLASTILLLKSKNIQADEIPFSLISLFLADETAAIRANGMTLLNNYPTDFLNTQTEALLELIHNQYPEVVAAILDRIEQLGVVQPLFLDQALVALGHGLIKNEKFEGSHLLFKKMILDQPKTQLNSAFNPRMLIKMIHAQNRQSQLTGYEILVHYSLKDEFTLGQIVSLANHEILAIRQWCWNYFNDNPARICAERNQALALLDTHWDDSRAFAFHYFKTNFDQSHWDLDCLIALVDSVLPAVEQFGKEMITRYFDPKDGLAYLTQLSQHPSVNIQFFVTNYLNTYAVNNLDKLQELAFYFRSVLTRVHQARVAKNRVFAFLHQEGIKSLEAAVFVSGIIDAVSATVLIQDKARCIAILTDLKRVYPQLHTHLIIKN